MAGTHKCEIPALCRRLKISQRLLLSAGQLGNPIVVDRRFDLDLLVGQLGPFDHFRATERTALVGPECAQTLTRKSDFEQLFKRVDVDFLLVVLNFHRETPTRELRTGNADGGWNLGLIANTLALVHNPGQISLLGDVLLNFASDGVGIHEWQIDAENGKKVKQSRRLGRADLLLAVLDILATADQATDEHFDGQSDDTVAGAIDLSFGLIDRGAILLLGRTDASIETIERRLRHHIHHEGSNADDFKQKLLHTVLLESLTLSAPIHETNIRQEHPVEHKDTLSYH